MTIGKNVYKAITPTMQLEVVKAMLKDNIVFINSGIFEIEEKKFILSMEIKEVK